MDIVPFGAYNRHYSWFPGSLNTKEQSGRCIRASAILLAGLCATVRQDFFFCERACSLVVTRASVAPEILGSTPHGSEYSGI